MPTSRRVLCVLSIALGMCLAPGGPALGQSGATAALVDLRLAESSAWATDPGASEAVIVALDGPTTFDLFKADGLSLSEAVTPDVSAHLDSIFAGVAAAQAPARAAVLATGAEIISTYDTALNGFLVYATEAQASELARIPGAQGIWLAPRHYPLVEDAVPQIGADAVAAHYGFTGKDVTIAIIDTGIDYTHKSLGGPGRRQDYTRASQDPARVLREFYPNAKVKGGWDFAGRAYNGGNAPAPDPNPLDEHNHGTHVAGIAAGIDGARGVSHGVAPGATLVALKVFGAQGSTNLATNAIEWTIEANMGRRVDGVCPADATGRCRIDVANLSLGAAWANGVLDDLGVVKRAMEAGVVIIAAAGNDGDIPFITGSPAASPHALSVASTVPAGEVADKIEVIHAGETTDFEALEADASLTTARMRDVRTLRERVAWFGRGCPGDRIESDVREQIALIERGSCVFQQKLAAAQAAGAVAAIVYSTGADLVAMPSTSGSVSIPAYMITQLDGLALRDMIERGSTEATFNNQWAGSIRREGITDSASGFTSRGPSRLEVLKPNIGGPGSQINAPRRGTGDEGVKYDGTSMASPIVAGAAAVLIERLRSQGISAPSLPLTPDQPVSALDVAALLVNSAGPKVWEGDSRQGIPAPIVRGGGGRVDVAAAVELSTVVRAGTPAADGLTTPFGITFGLVSFDDTNVQRRPFFVRNVSDASRNYKVSSTFANPDDAASGVTFSASQEMFELAPGEAIQLDLNAHLEPLDMKAYSAYGGDAATVGRGGLNAAEHDAYVVVTEVDTSGDPVPDGDVAQLPVYILPRASTAISMAGPAIPISPSAGEGTAAFTNASPQSGRVEFFVPLAEDPREGGLSPAMDVGHVGVRVGRDDSGERTVEFLVHSRGTRTMPFDTQVNVAIDVGADGTWDFLAWNTDPGLWPPPRFNPNAAYTGHQAVVVTRITQSQPNIGVSVNPSDWQVPYYAGVDQTSNAVHLPMQAAFLGFNPSDPVKLRAVVFHQANFPEVLAGGGASQDVVPDGALQGGLGTAGLDFDSQALGFELDTWSYLAAPGPAGVNIRKVGTGGLGPLLAFYPLNVPDRNVELVRLEEREPPVPEPRWMTVFLPAAKNREAPNN